MITLRYIYEPGQQVNYLTVIKLDFFIKENSKKPNYYYLCKCPLCNKEFWINQKFVHTQKSCGCLRSERLKLKIEGEAARNQYYHQYKKSAFHKNLEFLLTTEQFTNLTSQNCHYCGDIPTLYYFPRRSWGGYLHNGIDRVDSSRGYTIDNCVPCCKTCNFAKNALSYEEFIEWIDRIVKFRGQNAS
jgi:hypothetical protein